MNTLRAERRLTVVSLLNCITRVTARERDLVGPRLLSILSALPLCAMLAIAPANAQTGRPTIQVLSNRADLISGGDALVQINLPASVNPAFGVKVALNGALINSMFAVRPNGRYQGLVTGLNNGDNLLTVTTPQGRAKITITNHPIGGPVFAGAQLQPWICATMVAQTVSVIGNPGSTPPTATATTRASGLSSDPLDVQCDTPPTYSYYYQPKALEGTSCTFTITGASPCFVAFPSLNDPTTRPADSAIANFTNDRGDTVKSLIRVERGSINRTIYQLVTFYDPLDANLPWAPPKGWNGKLIWRMGPSASVSRFEQSPAISVFDDKTLSRGFMIATSSLTDHGTNSNDTLGAETVMMTKELIIEKYGPIRYTIGDGCSGGSIMQHSIASAYPGLLDGIQPNCSFQDTFTTGIEIADCGALQAHYYLTPNGSALTLAQKLAINGHKLSTGGTPPNVGLGFCQSWISSFLPAFDPTRAANCGFPTNYALVYSATNPHGIRCDGADHDVGMVGTFVDTDGIAKANVPNDNVGLQYGLKALQSGVISAEQFVQLNEGVGGYNTDLVWSASSRTEADPGALSTYYSGGLVSDGRQLAKVPIIDLRGNESPAGDIHSNWRPWGLRDRLDRDHGGHSNQLIYAYNSATGSSAAGAALTLKAFLTIDTWLANIESDLSANPIEVKVVNNKPAGAADLCTLGTGATQADVDAAVPLTDPTCPVQFEASPRQAAGGPLAENVFKCQLKPLSFADPDYTGVLFSPNQQMRLQAVFPTGLCDWSKPGVAQVPVNPWTTFAAGPGGQPLPPPPTSTPF